jgi:hypothetical protein
MNYEWIINALQVNYEWTMSGLQSHKWKSTWMKSINHVIMFNVGVCDTKKED